MRGMAGAGLHSGGAQWRGRGARPNVKGLHLPVSRLSANYTVEAALM